MALEESSVELTEEKMEKMAILPDNNNSDQHETTPKSKKKGGIITMPFIIVNEAFEKVASYGLLPNMIFYLMNVYHLEAAKGVIVLSLWSGISNALAIVGGFLSDSYFGRFRVIAFGTFCSLLGTSLLWLTSVVPALKPAPCARSSSESCSSATPIQFLVLFGSFGLISIGAGCVRPCSLAFGADQVSNKDNPNNERVLDSFFNWYYASTGLATIIALTVIVFIQDKFGWPIGFGVPVCLMILSLVAFFFGSPLYVHVKAKDSLFIGMFQVPVAAFRKRNVSLPPIDAEELYFGGNNGSEKKVPSDSLRCLNKACVIVDPVNDLKPDGSASKPWSLCTVERVENLKSILRIMPMWTTGIMMLVAMNNSYTTLQAKSMDRHITPKFEIPAGSFTVFSVVTITFWVAFYDRAVVPLMSKFCGMPRGLTPKVRMGLGLLLSCVALIVAAIVESVRRKAAINHGLQDNPRGVLDMSAVEQGILQLIAEHNIEKLVMGAAQDDCYQMKMMEPVSKKAIYVQLHAPAKCHIWFICKGHLIHQRKFSSEERIHAQNERSINSNFLSVNGQSNKSIIGKKELIFGEGSSQFDTSNGRFTDLSSMDNIKTHVSLPEFDLEANCYDWGEFLEQNHQRHLSSSHSDAQEISSGAYAEAERKCKELEEELEKLKNDRDKLREKYQDAMDQNLVLEGKVANYDQVLKELEEGFISNVELLQVCEKDRDDLKIERDSVLKTAEELLNQSAEAASKSDDLRFFTTFTFAEIERATNDFDPSFQLWEGENGSIYKGVISHTQVTIKMWRPEGLQGPQEFHREVEILSKFRHPNVVTLMGVCPEAWAIVYEFLPNGSLQERLNSTGDTDNIPLSWQTRIRIATELCCVLIFLHCHGPERVVHGALNPTSIYLDSNFTCKISDFGTELSNSSSYTDPEYIMTEVATPAMDVYSFGLILLELLTGKPASDITYELEDALNENSFDTLLDSSAGDWPFVQAEQLARLALRCCEENASDRPDLESDVWRILEPMRTSCGGSTSYHLGDEHRQAPSYFICPIFQEVMKDPHVAADGYTYEAEALQGWLDGDHDTSPMTNLQLEHCNLVPNHALRSAIQEWRQRH